MLCVLAAQCTPCKARNGTPNASLPATRRARRRRGACVCVIGEPPGGDTGTRAFAGALAAGFRLVQRLPLPNWSDTAHDLTIWERRRPAPCPGPGREPGDLCETPLDGTSEAVAPRDGRPSALPALECAACGGGAHGGGGGGTRGGTVARGGARAPAAQERGAAGARKRRRGLQAAAGPGPAAALRCRWCRDIFCSLACVRAGAAAHAARHALRLLFFARRSMVEPSDYEPMDAA